MIRRLLCGCCNNGCMCATHAADRKHSVCLSHRADMLRRVSFDDYMLLSDEETDSGLYLIDIDQQGRAKYDARVNRDFRCDEAEERNGTYR